MRPFREKTPPPPPPLDRREWNEDWKIGDVAECVQDNWADDVRPWERPAIGERLVVTGFSEGLGRSTKTLRYFLHFAEYSAGFTTTTFRKVRPVAAGNSEIVERILKAKPGKDRTKERA